MEVQKESEAKESEAKEVNRLGDHDYHRTGLFILALPRKTTTVFEIHRKLLMALEIDASPKTIKRVIRLHHLSDVLLHPPKLATDPPSPTVTIDQVAEMVDARIEAIANEKRYLRSHS